MTASGATSSDARRDVPARLECDVLVIGGGPAGSTAAIRLAEQGHRVAVLDKARHPRFHIGESLLPANLPLFDALGVGDAVRAIGMHKPGAEFVSPWHDRAQTFYFADAWSKSMPSAYQVRRADFDAILFERAAEVGAIALDGCRVTDVRFDDAGRGARATAWRDGHGSDERERIEIDARFVIDASGRDTFLANRFKSKVRNARHNSSALYGHFRHARLNPGQDAGNITVFWFEHGWFWFIPLADGTTSVGAVVWPYYLQSRTTSLETFFRDTIALCPPLAERLGDATLVSGPEATGNFAYASNHVRGPNYLMVGDAYTFIDPVFSSGVMLAMNGAFEAADAVHAWLESPAQAEPAMRRFERAMRHGPRAFSWFIYRVTNPTMRDLFMAPRNTLRMKEALLSLLAGDIFGETPIWRSIFALKVVYYVWSALHPLRTWRATMRRRNNIRVVGQPMSGSA
ncbi:NAD(P)/FAD-dependent oxidoreductase [Pararobbsia silviterrae]|uniref:NAD(P)/FAD-dependent oxidoreductase n=1 Tax=Pararobbsia silviterrae TaxID=1792498 RepID=A0A494XEM4_9BURK|nr:NAD(P)/FAD-dependent oxidoreductase [Pararobbsia silviterrae]RKP46594.1 NAD(P)/FAD-dependent oxidoreductase [Pararobbsia silviterrae]